MTHGCTAVPGNEIETIALMKPCETKRSQNPLNLPLVQHANIDPEQLHRNGTYERMQNGSYARAVSTLLSS